MEQNLIQFKTETVRAYQEMAMELTMIKGLTETAIGRLAGIQWQINQRFNKMETRLDGLETTLDSHTQLLNQILARLPEKF